MSRPLRIEYAGAWYHVMNRGIDRQIIYKNLEHKEIFINLLEEISRKFYVEIHAFCLMSNHYHLVVRTCIPNLGKAMRHLDGLYTRRFNNSQQRDGSIFRGRYKAILIEEENYLLHVSRYIHLNPVAAKICHHPSEYQWSSYRYYANKEINLVWLKKSDILKYFHHDNTTDYEEFVSEGIDEELKIFYSKKIFSPILGSKEFCKNILETTRKDQQIFSLPDINRIKHLPSLDDISKIITTYFAIEIPDLKVTKPGCQNIPRMLAIFFAKQCGQLTYQKISDYFTKITPTSVGMVINRFEKLILHDENIKNHFENLSKIILKNMLYVNT